jgi:hypothetical protein
MERRQCDRDVGAAADPGGLRDRWPHLNMMVIGPPSRLDRILSELADPRRAPVVFCTLPGPLVLPSSETLVLRDVAGLTRRQQTLLLQWMDDQRQRMPILSATAQRLFDLVRLGVFDERLYYRLNMVIVRA